MPRFKCVNENCPEKGKVNIIEQLKYIFDDKSSKLKPERPIICKECKQEMEEIPTGNTGGFFFTKFDSLSTQEKRRILHKRSMDHFKKHDKGDLANYKKKIIEDNKKMARGEL